MANHGRSAIAIDDELSAIPVTIKSADQQSNSDPVNGQQSSAKINF